MSSTPPHAHAGLSLKLIFVLTLVILAGTSVHPLVFTLILVPFSVISLTSLGVW
jgi:hypothetical protein